MRLMRRTRPNGYNWSPLAHFDTLQNEINRLLEAPLAEFSGENEVFNTWAPAIDVYEGKDNFLVTAEVPGMNKEDIAISLHDGALMIAGERKEGDQHAQTTEAHRAERCQGQFQRTISLPKQVDVNGVKASYRDGILTVTLPKAPEAKPRHIEVSVN